LLTSRAKHTGRTHSVCTSMADALHEKQRRAGGFVGKDIVRPRPAVSGSEHTKRWKQIIGDNVG
jgi:hypothetical protein